MHLKWAFNEIADNCLYARPQLAMGLGDNMRQKALPALAPGSLAIKCATTKETSKKGCAWDMDRVFDDQNIERYRRLACPATTDIEKTRLLNLMRQQAHNHIAREKRL